MKTKSLMLTILIALQAISFNSCNKDDNQNITPPALPPIESMSLPMSGFTVKSANNNQQSYTWFAVSAITVGVWNSVIGVTLAVPVLSFTEAINHERIQVNNNLWRWSYNVTALSDVYTAELEASLNGELVIWEMYISKTGAGSFSRFKWFTGISMPDGTNGSWVIYKSPTENNEMYEIVWNKNLKAGTSDITYTNVLDDDINKGSYIKYEKTTASPYNVLYTIYGNTEIKTVTIKWSSLTTAGSITINKNGVIDGPHCWDSTKSDILICPN